MTAAYDRAKLRNRKRHSAQQHRKMANARAAQARKRLESPPPPNGRTLRWRDGSPVTSLSEAAELLRKRAVRERRFVVSE